MTINNFPTSEQILERYPQIKAIKYIDGASNAVTLTHAGIKKQGKSCRFYCSAEMACDLYLIQFFKFLDEFAKGDCELLWRNEPVIKYAQFHEFDEINHTIYPRREITAAWIFSRLLIVPIEGADDK